MHLSCFCAPWVRGKIQQLHIARHVRCWSALKYKIKSEWRRTPQDKLLDRRDDRVVLRLVSTQAFMKLGSQTANSTEELFLLHSDFDGDCQKIQNKIVL